MGWINTARYKWAEITGRKIKFKPATFYLGVADLLARSVESQGQDSKAEQYEPIPKISSKESEHGNEVDGGVSRSTMNESDIEGDREPLDQLERSHADEGVHLAERKQ